MRPTQAGLFPTLHDGWPPVVSPLYPQNPIVASSRDPNTNGDARMQMGLSGLAAGSFRAPMGRMIPPRRMMTRDLRMLSAARIPVGPSVARKIGMHGPCGNGLAGPCDDHTAQNWADALGSGLQVFGQVATSIGTSQHDTGWTQAGSISSTVGAGEHTITSGLCNPTTPAQSFVGSENDMQNQITAAKNTATPQVASPSAAPASGTPKWVPWAVGGGVVAALAIGAAIFFRR